MRSAAEHSIARGPASRGKTREGRREVAIKKLRVEAGGVAKAVQIDAYHTIPASVAILLLLVS